MTREERAALAVVDGRGLARHVRERFSALQLIGECGRGKTTRMLALLRWLPEATYVYLPEDGGCPAIPAGDPLLIDEAQRLPRRVRRSVFETGLPLVLATHRDLRRPLQRAGYQVHTERIGESNDEQLIVRSLNRRIEASRLREGAVPVLTHDDAHWLVARFGDDLRSIESYLYDRVQNQVFSHGEMRFVD